MRHVAVQHQGGCMSWSMWMRCCSREGARLVTYLPACLGVSNNVIHRRNSTTSTFWCMECLLRARVLHGCSSSGMPLGRVVWSARERFPNTFGRSFSSRSLSWLLSRTASTAELAAMNLCSHKHLWLIWFRLICSTFRRGNMFRWLLL